MSHVTTGDFGVGSWVERRARITPDHSALISGARSLTYAELAERIRRLANGLRHLGVARGDRVAWVGPNHTAFLESLFAVGQLGAVLAPVNHRLGPDERAFVLAHTEPIVLVQHDVAEPAATASVRHRLTVGGSLERAIDYEALVAESPDHPIGETVGLDDLKVGSAGKPPLLADVRISDEAGGDVAPGQTGELLVRGPNVMTGYWKRPAETRDVLIEGGWLRTGDAARMDDDGYIWIVDRLVARFVSAGKVVYPGDVERALLAHPSVADSGVVGVPAPRGGKVGAAFVVLSPGGTATEDELLAFCRARLAAHQIPTSISFVGGLPRNAAGKLLRAELSRLASRGPLGGD